MKFLNPIILTITILFTTSCESKVKKSPENQDIQRANPIVKLTDNELQKYEVAYFASGCFWCVEAIYENVIGVKEVISGYAGGTELNPTYEQVGGGHTSHAEAVKVYYDESKVSFETLVKVFFASHDPTTLNRQGPDVGPQYRSIAFYSTQSEKEIIEKYISKLENGNMFNAPIVTEVKKLKKFYDAEEYHQDYEKLHPNNPYIRNISIPRYNRFKAKHPELMKKNLH